ncbi:putative reverse transcriptase domain-containing protein [Tanacetum coccineum]
MMTTEYCPATEIQRMEQELWTLTLKGDDIEAYNNRFHELALMCHELVPTEKKKIERYIRGFPERIKGQHNFQSLRPCMRQSTWPENVQMHYAAAQLEEKIYARNLPKCPKAGNQQLFGARGRAYVVVENPQQNPNVVTGTFLLNDHYACILFDSGAEKSFVSSAFTHFSFLELRSRKFHSLEDNQIPSVGVFDEVFSIWKAFGGNTRDLGSFREEMDKTTDLHQHLSRLYSQQLETASQITRDAVTIHTKTASQDLKTASECTTHPII